MEQISEIKLQIQGLSKEVKSADTLRALHQSFTSKVKKNPDSYSITGILNFFSDLLCKWDFLVLWWSWNFKLESLKLKQATEFPSDWEDLFLIMNNEEEKNKLPDNIRKIIEGISAPINAYIAQINELKEKNLQLLKKDEENEALIAAKNEEIARMSERIERLKRTIDIVGDLKLDNFMREFYLIKEHAKIQDQKHLEQENKASQPQEETKDAVSLGNNSLEKPKIYEKIQLQDSEKVENPVMANNEENFEKNPNLEIARGGVSSQSRQEIIEENSEIGIEKDKEYIDREPIEQHQPSLEIYDDWQSYKNTLRDKDNKPLRLSNEEMVHIYKHSPYSQRKIVNIMKYFMGIANEIDEINRKEGFAYD